MNKSVFNFLKITLIVSAVIYLIDQGADWINGEALGSLSSELKIFSIYLLYGFLIGGANIYLITALDKRISWKKAPKKRLIVGLLGSILVSLHAVGLARLIVNFINGHTVEYFIEHEKAINYFYALIITLVIVLFFHAYYFYKALFEKKVEASEFEAKTESAKYESLKSQLDPHFLFNSLNVLTALIGEDPTKAERFTTKLSKVYRYVLEQKEKDLIPLQEELDFAKTYMDLLKMRFEDAVVFDLPKTLSNPNFKIAPLTLQILLENAVKHNVISKESPLTISIAIEGNVLLVNNKINKKSTLKKSTHVGLNNIIERYALVTNRKIEIIEKEGNFRVIIPLLTEKIKIMETDIKINERYLRAQKQVKDIKEFYSSLLSYIIVIPFLYYVWYTFTPFTIQWFWFPAIGWGIGLVFHATRAFNFAPVLGRNWEERKLKEFMKEDEKEYWK